MSVLQLLGLAPGARYARPAGPCT